MCFVYLVVNLEKKNGLQYVITYDFDQTVRAIIQITIIKWLDISSNMSNNRYIIDSTIIEWILPVAEISLGVIRVQNDVTFPRKFRKILEKKNGLL